jgi:hypothetical protein
MVVRFNNKVRNRLSQDRVFNASRVKVVFQGGELQTEFRWSFDFDTIILGG